MLKTAIWALSKIKRSNCVVRGRKKRKSSTGARRKVRGELKRQIAFKPLCEMPD